MFLNVYFIFMQFIILYFCFFTLLPTDTKYYGEIVNIECFCCCYVCGRHKVRELIDFIQDDERLREERKKSKKNRDKYIGIGGVSQGSSDCEFRCVRCIATYFLPA